MGSIKEVNLFQQSATHTLGSAVAASVHMGFDPTPLNPIQYPHSSV